MTNQIWFWKLLCKTVFFSIINLANFKQYQATYLKINSCRPNVTIRSTSVVRSTGTKLLYQMLRTKLYRDRVCPRESKIITRPDSWPLPPPLLIFLAPLSLCPLSRETPGPHEHRFGLFQILEVSLRRFCSVSVVLLVIVAILVVVVVLSSSDGVDHDSRALWWRVWIAQ